MEELQQQALLDPLTGVGNRRYTEMDVVSRLEGMNRYGWPFGVAFVDIDHFKQVNDTYGHDTGDDVLKMISRTLLNSLRPFDFLGRWGGEEFVVSITYVSGDELSTVANRIRSLAEHSILSVPGSQLQVTVSIGVTPARPEDTPEALVKRADELMYRSKEAGRNRVTIG
jgi:diguanylate cyclase (GGDEF)-like protein